MKRRQFCRRMLEYSSEFKSYSASRRFVQPERRRGSGALRREYVSRDAESCRRLRGARGGDPARSVGLARPHGGAAPVPDPVGNSARRTTRGERGREDLPLVRRRLRGREVLPGVRSGARRRREARRRGLRAAMQNKNGADVPLRFLMPISHARQE